MRTDEALTVQGVHDKLMAEIERLRAALQDVLNPLDHLRRSAEASGGRLNEHAHGIANSLPYVQGIAARALDEGAPRE